MVKLLELFTRGLDNQSIRNTMTMVCYGMKLFFPDGEPPTHQSLSTCLHQISALAGVPKQTVNAIRSVAFLLEEMEDMQINILIREALDSQMTEFTSDFKLLIKDATERIDEHV